MSRTHGRTAAGEDVAAHPLQALLHVHALERRAHHILADDALHAKKPGVDGVTIRNVRKDTWEICWENCNMDFDLTP